MLLVALVKPQQYLPLPRGRPWLREPACPLLATLPTAPAADPGRSPWPAPGGEGEGVTGSGIGHVLLGLPTDTQRAGRSLRRETGIRDPFPCSFPGSFSVSACLLRCSRFIFFNLLKRILGLAIRYGALVLRPGGQTRDPAWKPQSLTTGPPGSPYLCLSLKTHADMNTSEQTLQCTGAPYSDGGHTHPEVGGGGRSTWATGGGPLRF